MRRTVLGALCATALLAACSGDNPHIGEPSVSSPVETTVVEPPASLEIHAGEPISPERCAANQAAGTIVYVSSYDFAASASIIDVLVADAHGYFDDLCLDVEIRPSFAGDNYTLVAGNDAQIGSGGSFSELVDFAGDNSAGYVVLGVEGRTGIDALITRKGAINSLEDLRGSTIGVEGALTPSVRSMLFEAGLLEGDGYEVLELEGADPAAELAMPEILGFTGYKNDEVFGLDQAGAEYDVYDPANHGIPGSFGVLYTNATFLTEFPTAVQDFMRATLKGLADALEHPNQAVGIALDAAEANGNPLGFTAASEQFRWSVEARLILQSASDPLPLGVPDRERLELEITTYAGAGLFDGIAPLLDSFFESPMVAELYDHGTLVWPA